MYVATPSETSRREIEALSDADREQLGEITLYIEKFLPVLRKGGLVKPYEFFGIHGLRYFDNSWPHLILMEIVQEPSDGVPGDIFFHLILPATINPPTQVRV